MIKIVMCIYQNNMPIVGGNRRVEKASMKENADISWHLKILQALRRTSSTHQRKFIAWCATVASQPMRDSASRVARTTARELFRAGARCLCRTATAIYYASLWRKCRSSTTMTSGSSAGVIAMAKSIAPRRRYLNQHIARGGMSSCARAPATSSSSQQPPATSGEYVGAVFITLAMCSRR